MTFSAFTGLLLTSETQFFCTVEAMGGGNTSVMTKRFGPYVWNQNSPHIKLGTLYHYFSNFFARGSSLCYIQDATAGLWGSHNPCLAGGCWTKELPPGSYGDRGLQARQHPTTDTSAQQQGATTWKTPRQLLFEIYCV